MQNQRQKFAEWLIGQRKIQNLTQRDLSALTPSYDDEEKGIHYSTIAAVERGERPPTRDFVYVIGQAFGLSPNEINEKLYGLGLSRIAPSDINDESLWWIAELRREFRGLSRDSIEFCLGAAKGVAGVERKAQAKGK